MQLQVVESTLHLQMGIGGGWSTAHSDTNLVTPLALKD